MLPRPGPPPHEEDDDGSKDGGQAEDEGAYNRVIGVRGESLGAAHGGVQRGGHGQVRRQHGTREHLGHAGLPGQLGRVGVGGQRGGDDVVDRGRRQWHCTEGGTRRVKRRASSLDLEKYRNLINFTKLITNLVGASRCSSSHLRQSWAVLVTAARGYKVPGR